MTNWHDPDIVIADNVALVKFIHVLGGIYLWEFISNVGFEYSVISGKRKFSRTFPLYLGCRLFPLLAIATQFLGFDLHHKVDCQAWVVAAFMFGYLSFAFASCLIVLRVVALWDRSRNVIAFASVFWLANIGLYIYCAVTSRAVWDEDAKSCSARHTEHSKIAVFATFMFDLVLLALMLLGLLRWKNGRQRHGIWWYLYTQGLVWVLIVTLAEVPPTVFIILNLNDPLNLIFQTLGLVIMTIGASRMYRGLAACFGSETNVIVDSGGPNGQV